MLRILTHSQYAPQSGLNCERRHTIVRAMFIASAIKWSPQLLITALSLLLAAWYWIWSRSRFVRLIDAIPGPKCVPLLGNLLELNVGLGHQDVSKKFTFDWSQQYDGIHRIWLAFFPYVVIGAPELLEPILSSKIIGPKPQECEPTKDYLGNSLGILAGEAWKQRRRMLKPAFHFQVLNSFVDVFNEKSADCANIFDKAIETHKGSEFNIMPLMTRFTLDIFCDTFMGQMTRTNEKKQQYLDCLDGINAILMERFFKPWLRIGWILKLSYLSRLNHLYMATTREFFNQVIKGRRKFLKQEEAKHSNHLMPNGTDNNNINADDILDPPRKRPVFLDTLLKTAEESSDFTDIDVRDEVGAFMVAGHDTTAFTLAMFIYLMAKYPDQQQLVVDELAEVFGDSNRPCMTNDFAKLKYLECCIKETLRLYPSVPLMLRSVPEDMQAGGFMLPKGLSVILNFYATHHNPAVFTDPESFKPERFLPENSIGRHPYAFVPFSGGLRNCIGKSYIQWNNKNKPRCFTR